MRLSVPLLIVLVGCADESGVPTENISDFRMTFESAEASSSCTSDIAAEAEAFAEFSQIYRIHFPLAEDDPSRIDLYWKAEGDPDDQFSYFAAGTIDGNGLDGGSVTYGGGPFSQERGSGETVTYEIEGAARASFGDLWDAASEEYVFVGSDSSDFPAGCIFTVHYAGALLAEQEP